MSWPPGWSLVDDGSPSSTNGLRLARAVYRAAVWPAGPEPMIRTSRGSATAVLFDSSALASGSLPRLLPEQQSGEREKSSEDQVHDPHAAGDVVVENPHHEDREHHHGDR